MLGMPILRLLANVKLAGFRSQVKTSRVYSHTDELSCNETVCPLMTMYIYIKREREWEREN